MPRQEAATRELIQRCLADNRERLFRLALRLCRNRADADDLVQRASMRAIERAALYRTPERDPLPWVITILGNLYVDDLRAPLKIEPLRDSLDEVPDRDEGRAGEEGSPMWERVTVEQVVSAMEMLQADLRRAIELREFEGLRYKEIASRLDVSVDIVKARIHRARVFLRAILIERHGTKGE